MQIRPDPNSRHDRLEPLRTDITRPSRRGVERTVEAFRSQQGDLIELSSEAARLAEVAEAAEDSAQHRAKVQELMEQYRSGRLLTRERDEAAAEALLRPRQ